MPTKGKIKGMDVNLDDKVMFLTNHDNGFVYYYQMQSTFPVSLQPILLNFDKFLGKQNHISEQFQGIQRAKKCVLFPWKKGNLRES